MFNIRKNKKELQMKLEKLQRNILAWVFAPCFFLLQLITVDAGLPIKLLGIYSFINLFGNMVLSIRRDTSTRSFSRNDGGENCARCGVTRPARAWHCPKCDVCIVGSGHHCIFLSHCIGRYNYRYFILCLGHISFCMSYCIAFYCCNINFNFDLALLLPTMNMEDFDTNIMNLRHNDNALKEYMNALYLQYFLFDLLLFAVATYYFIFHMTLVLIGMSTYEDVKRGDCVRRHWKTELEYVFGTRWYWAILWPFVTSPLPEEKIA